MDCWLSRDPSCALPEDAPGWLRIPAPWRRALRTLPASIACLAKDLRSSTPPGRSMSGDTMPDQPDFDFLLDGLPTADAARSNRFFAAAWDALIARAVRSS